jgi:serine/threonine protein phosphatase PrpC
MTVWKSFGASVIGPKHIRSGELNQDAWAAFHHTWGDGIIVSDGLGSKTLSGFGSKAACYAAANAAYICRDKTEIDQNFLSDKIKSNWLSLIAPLNAHDCSATCLFAFRFSNGVIRLGMLGDGLIAILKIDGTVMSFDENKTNGFSNLVNSSLSAKITGRDWQFLEIHENHCRAVLICTDGISDDLADTGRFVREFVTYHVDLAVVSASRKTREMLEKWPTPKHSDDKTLACLFRKDADDE